MIVELEITDPRGVNSRGAKLEKGERIKLDQHDGRARAWLRFGQARLIPGERPAGPDGQDREETKAEARGRGGRK